ncbi:MULTISPECIES: LysR family transcriptional regulator [Bacillus cereus group]|uniref:LysR family transcriptional regulator n=1 Tax=Bacillus cereus group TaxID=86661 RepID=UPI001F5617BB|nr:MULTISPECIES: LysR family transcriptional regulator [Bacillus cereus group]MDA1577073.1 LysR family transcriptional regulator [Bacillus cereus group sp. TH228LC]MDA1830611.1 LysR family transcriptional regulator [Bacillus cereus group sp. BY142LC]MDA1835667.1 LysR family transcriptional regulator [Bacillus cereus group sp. BY17LC]MEC2920783.1 LysR family transcriptional regulator [Bacillus tropicus]MEC2922582.1 LysR family transcriptional regulator [Bacillus tropicus]
MEMRHVKTFCAIVKYGGFSKAAHALGYAQSTVTAHMKALENDLHIPLFDRLGKKVLLTKAGHQFHPYALELLAIYEKAQEIPQNTDQLEGTLSITSNESLAVYRLPQLLRAYKQKNPKVNIVLETNTNEQAINKLREGETDVIFIIGESMEHNDFITLTFSNETFGWILPIHSPIHANPFHLLQDTQFIFTEQSCGYRPMVDRFLRQSGNIPEKTFETSNVEVIKQAVMCELGISILPYIVVQENCQKEQIQFQPIETPAVIQSHVIYHKSRWISPVLQSFLSLLEKN